MYGGEEELIPSDEPQTHLNDDAPTLVLLLQATREEIHKGLCTKQNEKSSFILYFCYHNPNGWLDETNR